MKKSFIECKGEKYPIRTVNIGDFYDDEELQGEIDVADVDLYWAYEDEYWKGDPEINDLDGSIYFFCDTGFIASDPTDKEIVDYLIKAGV